MVKNIRLKVGTRPQDTTLEIEGENAMSRGGVRSLELRVEPHEFPHLKLSVYTEEFSLNGPVSLQVLEEGRVERAFGFAVFLPTDEELDRLLIDCDPTLLIHERERRLLRAFLNARSIRFHEPVTLPETEAPHAG